MHVMLESAAHTKSTHSYPLLSLLSVERLQGLPPSSLQKVDRSHTTFLYSLLLLYLGGGIPQITTSTDNLRLAPESSTISTPGIPAA